MNLTDLEKELKSIKNEYANKRKMLRKLQNTEGVTKTVYGSCYVFNLGNELDNDTFKKMFS